MNDAEIQEAQRIADSLLRDLGYSPETLLPLYFPR